MLKKLNIFYFFLSLCIILNVLSAVLYFLIFDGDFSSRNTDWGTFGDFIGGVANFLNLIILVLISILLKNIDESQKKNEINLQLKISFFERFLTSYEDILNELTNMKIYLSVEDKTNDHTHVQEMALESFKKFKYMFTIFQNYFPVRKKNISFLKLETSFASFLGSIDLKKDEEIIDNNKANLIKEVELIISLLSELITDIKTNFIDNYGTEKT